MATVDDSDAGSVYRRPRAQNAEKTLQALVLKIVVWYNINMITFRVATYNVYARLAAAKAGADLRNLLSEVDVAAFQEFGSSEDRRQLNAIDGFDNRRGKDISLPIAWRTSEFKYLDSGSFFLSDATDVGRAGAGPRVLKRKDAFWVKLKHRKSRRVFVFVNSHLAPSIYLDVRYDLHDAQTDRLVELSKKFRFANLIMLGDYNVDFLNDKARRDPKMPVLKFATRRIVSTFATLGKPGVGTHGKRLIDYVWYRVRNRRFRPVQQRVLRGFHSDHKPLWVKFRVSRRLFR